MTKVIRRLIVFLLVLSMFTLDAENAFAKVEKYEDDRYGDGGGIYRYRKKYGVLASHVRDVKVGTDNTFLSTKIAVSQKKGCYHEIDFSKKQGKSYSIRYKNRVIGSNMRDFLLVSPYTAIYRNQKGKLREKGNYSLLPSKKKQQIKNYWGNNTMFAYVVDNVLKIRWQDSKKTKNYFAGTASNILKVEAGNSTYGERNVFVLMKDGSVWGLGDNHCHLISDTSQKTYQDFVQIISKGVKDISASQRNVAILKKDSSLWIWGENRKGKKKSYSVLPKKVDNKVKQFSMSQNKSKDAGATIMAYVKKSGQAYGWGSNKGWGMTTACGTKWHNKPVKLKNNIRKVFVADEVVLLLSRKKVLYWSGHCYGASDLLS